MEAVKVAITTVNMNSFRVLCIYFAECKICTEGRSVCGETIAGQGRARSNFEWREKTREWKRSWRERSPA